MEPLHYVKPWDHALTCHVLIQEGCVLTSDCSIHCVHVRTCSWDNRKLSVIIDKCPYFGGSLIERVHCIIIKISSGTIASLLNNLLLHKPLLGLVQNSELTTNTNTTQMSYVCLTKHNARIQTMISLHNNCGTGWTTSRPLVSHSEPSLMLYYTEAVRHSDNYAALPQPLTTSIAWRLVCSPWWPWMATKTPPLTTDSKMTVPSGISLRRKSELMSGLPCVSIYSKGKIRTVEVVAIVLLQCHAFNVHSLCGL